MKNFLAVRAAGGPAEQNDIGAGLTDLIGRDLRVIRRRNYLKIRLLFEKFGKAIPEQAIVIDYNDANSGHNTVADCAFDYWKSL